MESSKACWKCKTKIEFKTFICPHCFTIQKSFDLNPYDVFQLNKVYDIDKELLEERYLELQKTLHPDKFINTTDLENDAYRYALK